MDIQVSPDDHSLRVALRVTPGAGRDQIVGIGTEGAGQGRLLIRVTAPPEGGKANKAVIRLLAKAWQVPKSAMEIVTGAKGRNKILRIEAAEDASALLKRLEEWGKDIEH